MLSSCLSSIARLSPDSAGNAVTISGSAVHEEGFPGCQCAGREISLLSVAVPACQPNRIRRHGRKIIAFSLLMKEPFKSLMVLLP